MSFREQLERDLAVIMDEDIFATWHSFAGRRLLMIVDDSRLQEYALKGLPGLYEATHLLYIKRSDLQGLVMREGAPVIFDGSQYTITWAVETDGVMEVALGGVRQ